MSTQKRFPYMGRTITLVCMDIFHWTTLVDHSALYQRRRKDGEEIEIVFPSKRQAMTAGFDFVYKLSVDEGKVTSI